MELIADLLDAYGEARTTEVAKRLGVTHPTAVKGLGRLKREGLATSRPYRGIFLTNAGGTTPSASRSGAGLSALRLAARAAQSSSGGRSR